MFDIGFWELMLISVLGLVILGPERLPGAVRSVLKTVRRAKALANQVGDELKQELELDELHRALKQAEEQGFDNIKDAHLKEQLEILRQRTEAVTKPYSNTADDTHKDTAQGGKHE